MVKLVSGSTEVNLKHFKEEVDTEKQDLRNTITKCEEDEEAIKTQIGFLENMIIQQKQALVDKKKDLEGHRDHLINFDSKRYIELGCRGFPEDSLGFEIFHGLEMKGMEGKRNRMEVKGVTVVPRGFMMSHLFEFDYEPKEEEVSMKLISPEKMVITIDVPQEYKEWHNKEKKD